MKKNQGNNPKQPSGLFRWFHCKNLCDKQTCLAIDWCRHYNPLR